MRFCAFSRILRSRATSAMKNLRHHKILVSIVLIMGITATIWLLQFRVTYDQYGIPSRPVSYEFISSKPEAKLFYPTGTVVQPFGDGQKKSLYSKSGYGVAFAGAVMSSTDSPEQIYAWYRDWLLSHGWTLFDDDFKTLVDTQTSKQAYTKNNLDWGDSRETFYVAMNDPKVISEAIGKKVPASTTIFEFEYAIK